MTAPAVPQRLAAPEPGWSRDRRRGRRVRDRRADGRAALGPQRRSGAAGDEGRALGRLHPLGAGRHRRRPRSGGPPEEHLAGHPRRRRRALRRGRCARPRHEGPAAVRELIAARRTFDRPATASCRSPARAVIIATASRTPAATPPAPRSSARSSPRSRDAPTIEVIEHALVARPAARRGRRGRRRHPARDGRGPARRRRRGARAAPSCSPPAASARSSPRPPTRGVHRRRRRAGAAGRRGAPRPRVRAVPPDRAVARAAAAGPAAAGLRGGSRRGRVPRRRRRRAVHARASTSSPISRRATSWRRRSCAGCARPAPSTSGWTPGTSATRSGGCASRPSWRPAVARDRPGHAN